VEFDRRFARVGASRSSAVPDRFLAVTSADPRNREEAVPGRAFRALAGVRADSVLANRASRNVASRESFGAVERSLLRRNAALVEVSDFNPSRNPLKRGLGPRSSDRVIDVEFTSLPQTPRRERRTVRDFEGSSQILRVLVVNVDRAFFVVISLLQAHHSVAFLVASERQGRRRFVNASMRRCVNVPALARAFRVRPVFVGRTNLILGRALREAGALVDSRDRAAAEVGRQSL
jgi:hypothetical protein